MLHEEGDEHSGDGEVGSRADQTDGESEEAAHPGGVDTPGQALRPSALGIPSAGSPPAGLIAPLDGSGTPSIASLTPGFVPDLVLGRSRRRLARPSVGGRLRGHLCPRPCGPVDLDVGQPQLAEPLPQLGLDVTEPALEPVEQASERIDGQTCLVEHGRLVREVDRRQLEEPVAVVGDDHLDR